MGSMDAAERFAAAREEGEAVVSSGRQPSHAGQSRKKSFKTMKAEACLMPTHTNTQSRQHMCSPLHTQQCHFGAPQRQVLLPGHFPGPSHSVGAEVGRSAVVQWD